MAGILKVDRVQSDSNLAFQVGSSNVAYFNTTGMNLSGGEIIAGGNTLRTTGGLIYANNGIAFPASAWSSSDPNTLDDYEEGTWTPVIGATSHSYTTATFSNAKYVKIGTLVMAQFSVEFSGTSGNWADADAMNCTGLPFSVAYGTGTAGAFWSSANWMAGTRASGVAMVYNPNLVYLGFEYTGSMPKSGPLQVGVTYYTY